MTARRDLASRAPLYNLHIVRLAVESQAFITELNISFIAPANSCTSNISMAYKDSQFQVVEPSTFV